MEKKFLFVCGCARSGTSAFVRILSKSHYVLLGMERFSNLELPGNFKLRPEHFNKDRFFDVRPGDTFYDDFDGHHKFDPNARMKYDNCVVIGDKRPSLYDVYDDLYEYFPKAKILFIYRDPIEVASSYMGRIQAREKWPQNKDYKAAVNEWNRSLENTIVAAKKFNGIRTVGYDEVFRSDLSLEPIFKFIQVPYTERIAGSISKIRDTSHKLEESRELLLSEEQVSFIKGNANYALLDQIRKLNLI